MGVGETMMEASHRFNNDLRYRDESHPNQTQFTPEYVLGPVRSSFRGVIDLDPCTTEDNPTKAQEFYTTDGLSQPWCDEYYGRIFVNPPYGKAREEWVTRCIQAAITGHSVVLLIPAHSDTRIFQRAAKSAHAIVFIKGRIKFGVLRPNRRQMAASHPSALFCWNVDVEPLRVLGVVMVSA
jgi:hypothetical protein